MANMTKKHIDSQDFMIDVESEVDVELGIQTSESCFWEVLATVNAKVVEINIHRLASRPRLI